MGKIKDLTNERFGNLVVLYDTKERKNRQVVWHCICDCGKETDVVGQALRSGHTKSCGCGNYQSKNVEDLTNQVFNKLTVIERYGSDKNRHALWKCKCECGNIRIATTSELKQQNVKECRECAALSKKINYEDTKWYQEILNQKFGKLVPVKPTEKRNNAGKVIWECKCDCGNPNPVYVIASSLKNGNTNSCGCLQHTSIGEEIIANILIENNINFKRQFTFPDLFSPKGALLKFDFGIYNEQGTLKYLIEYDGIQHYKPVEYFGGEDAFKYLQECDKLKEEYCKDRNFPLIRINYLNKNITLEDLIL